MNALLVQDSDALSHLCQRLAGAPWVALDTEFTRERTYYARLGLIQLATEDVLACVDPRAVELTPLLDLLYDRSILKVLHAARQDLEVLHDLRRAVPEPLFDTQVAAALLGHPEQVGYATLVEAVTGVKLAKLHTRADWEARPLTEAQLRYAEDDVRYLRDVYRALAQELARRDRSRWLEEECAALLNPALYRGDPELAYTRLKPGNGIGLEAQGRLKALASWRERTAQTRDRPRGWIATDPQLMEIARAAPQDLAALACVPQITPPLTKTYGQEIVDTVCAAASAPTQRFWAEPRPPTPTEQTLARTLQTRIDAVAQAQGVSAGTIATRRALLEFIRDAGGPLTRGWRWELVGRELDTLKQQTLSA